MENPGPPARVRRRSKVPTEWEQAHFIELLRQGVHHVTAARAVGLTSSRFTALERRDQAFGSLAVEAQMIGGQTHRHVLRGIIRDAATNPRHPNHWAAVTKEADALLPEYEHKRTTLIGNAPGEELAIGANARISAEDLAKLPDEIVERLLELKQLERALERGEVPILRAIEGGGINGHE